MRYSTAVDNSLEVCETNEPRKEALVTVRKSDVKPWPPEKIWEFIRQKREEEGITDWEKIAKALAAAGNIGERTREPFTPQYCRYTFYYQRPGMKRKDKQPVDGAAREKLKTLKDIIALGGDPATKYSLIEKLLRED